MGELSIPALIPGTERPSLLPLSRYRPPQIADSIRQFLEASTHPGDLVLLAGDVEAQAVAETVKLGRKAVVLCRHPVQILRIQLALDPAPVSEVQAALTRLGDTLKSGQPLFKHIQDLNSTQCPKCGSPAIARWFAWDRETGHPYAKRVLCPRCHEEQEGTVSPEDIQNAGDFPVQTGLTYHIALGKLARAADPAIDRIIKLVQLYTPRSLRCLMDILNRISQVQVTPAARRALIALILEALDQGSALSPHEEPERRPRSLRPPSRFLERNIWLLLEDAATRYAREEEIRTLTALPATRAATSGSELLRATEAGYCIFQRSISAIDPKSFPTCQALVFTLGTPDAAYAALSTLWALWIWGQSVPKNLRYFLTRRRLDWDWYQRGVAFALRRLRQILTPGAPLLLTAPQSNTNAARAAMHGLLYAGLKLRVWISCPPIGHRLSCQSSTVSSPKAVPSIQETPTLAQVQRHAAAILKQRAEPITWRDLETLLIFDMRTTALPEVSPGNFPRLLSLEDGKLAWLSEEGPLRYRPLADRLEAKVLHLLSHQARWQTNDLVAEIYSAFHDILSPEPTLVRTCIEAYSRTDAEGWSVLREEDQPERRSAELRRLRNMIARLGERLGYVIMHHRGEIIWMRDGQRAYMFRVTETATLAPHLLVPPPPCDGRRCLVLPGGRASLVALKLRRDPRLQQQALRHRWTFVKFRHLRRMVEEIQEPEELDVYLGLDPLVEQPQTQLHLPLGGGNKLPWA